MPWRPRKRFSKSKFWPWRPQKVKANEKVRKKIFFKVMLLYTMNLLIFVKILFHFLSLWPWKMALKSWKSLKLELKTSLITWPLTFKKICNLAFDLIVHDFQSGHVKSLRFHFLLKLHFTANQNWRGWQM